MTTAEERMRVLKMIETGTVSAEEGARLLDTLRESHPQQQPTGSAPHSTGPRRFHVRVTDLVTGKSKVDIDLPWSLVSVGINMGARFTPPDVDIEAVMAGIDPDSSGKVLDIVDDKDSERVEIFVE
jgi:hypothetical protein